MTRTLRDDYITMMRKKLTPGATLCWAPTRHLSGLGMAATLKFYDEEYGCYAQEDQIVAHILGRPFGDVGIAHHPSSMLGCHHDLGNILYQDWRAFVFEEGQAVPEVYLPPWVLEKYPGQAVKSTAYGYKVITDLGLCIAQGNDKGD
jgi:hypothetical protein